MQEDYCNARWRWMASMPPRCGHVSDTKKIQTVIRYYDKANSQSPLFTLYQIVEFDLASNFRHQRDNLNSPYTADDFNG